jgi:hypothetical protein
LLKEYQLEFFGPEVGDAPEGLCGAPVVHEKTDDELRWDRAGICLREFEIFEPFQVIVLSNCIEFDYWTSQLHYCLDFSAFLDISPDRLKELLFKSSGKGRPPRFKVSKPESLLEFPRFGGRENSGNPLLLKGMVQ